MAENVVSFNSYLYFILKSPEINISSINKSVEINSIKFKLQYKYI